MSDVSTNYNILTIIKPSCFAFEKVMSRESDRQQRYSLFSDLFEFNGQRQFYCSIKV